MSWIQSDQGCGRLAYGAPQRPSEVSVDLPGGIVSVWPPDKVHRILSWIFTKGGHVMRIDCALDDRGKVISLETVRKAFEDGQYVTHAKRTNSMKTHSTATGSLEGETLYLGSTASETRLRIYGKSFQLKPKGHHDCSHFGNRWELQLRKARAHALGRELVLQSQHEWRRLVVGVLRNFVDFRDVTRGAPKWQRSRAKLLPWWGLLTEGFERAELAVETPEAWGLANIRRGLNQIATSLSVLVDLPGGREILESAIERGRLRRKEKHLKLLRQYGVLNNEKTARSEVDVFGSQNINIIAV